MNKNRRSDIFLLGFILLSLLLHLLFLFLAPKQAWVPAETEKKPVYVDLRPPQPLSRELDLPTPREPEKPRETPAKRLADAARQVEKETAPEGRDFEDRSPGAQAPPPAPQPAPPAKPEPRPVKPVPKPTEPTPKPSPKAVKPPADQRQLPPGEGPALPREAPAAPASPAPTQPQPQPRRSSKELKNIDLLASAKTAAANVGEQWRRKYRAEVDEGDTVWLDTEKDILISFFQRFRTNVYMVWNYPERARQLGQEGVSLLRVTITREGEVKGVILKESSGHPLLDNAAMNAVRKGASYGPLPTAYPKDELNIMVFFHYGLDRRPALY
jgi:protein TonB